MSKLDTDSKASVTNSELRKFGLLFGVILSGLFGILLPFLFHKAIPEWPWMVSAVFIVFAVIFPRALIMVYIPWMKFGIVAGWVNTRIILGLLFYFMFTPFGLLLRLFGKDLLSKKLIVQQETYRVSKSPQPKDHMETPY